MRQITLERVAAPNESGATATEYLFLMVFIALVVIVGSQLYGGALGSRLDGAATDVETVS